MSFCEKCGAYVPIGETVCPACGHDPEAEARAAREAEEKAAAEEKARQAAAAAAAFQQQQAAEAQAKRKAAEEQAREARERLRQEEERRRAEQQRRWEQDPRQQQGFTGGAAQGQYASQRAEAPKTQYTSQRTDSGAWSPPWQETQRSAGAGYDQRQRAADSVAHEKLSILSYLGILFLIPLLTRKDDDFARYHANQGLSLFLASAALTTLGSITGLGILGAAATIFQIYGAVKGISNVLRGKKEPLPFIGNWKLIK